MPLSCISITDFRNFTNIKLDNLQKEGFNFFYGMNGSGKTSLLEAIYYLVHKRSFRSLNANRLIRHSSKQFSVFSKISDRFSDNIPLGIERPFEGETRIHLAGKPVTKLTELLPYLPLRLINIYSHNLLEGGPVFRRKFLDWGLFYINPDFHSIWFQFHRILRQRNAALRNNASIKELMSWNQQINKAALAFDALRNEYFNLFAPVLQNILGDYFHFAPIEIRYQRGWDLNLSYDQVLEAAYNKDMERKSTYYGPHRADMSITANKIPAKDALSLGQQKLLACGMIIAQGALLNKVSDTTPIYLIDDLPSELDNASLTWLIGTLKQQKAQIFITAIKPKIVGNLLGKTDKPMNMFHVKHGEIRLVT